MNVPVSGLAAISLVAFLFTRETRERDPAQEEIVARPEPILCP